MRTRLEEKANHLPLDKIRIDKGQGRGKRIEELTLIDV